MLLILMLIFTEPNISDIAIESIYKPLSATKVAMANGHIYVLDTSAKLIHHFNDSGVSQPPIARQGQGPGEFMLPDSITILGESIFVTDYQKGTQVFKLDGEFLYSQKSTKPFVLLETVASGWVFEATDQEKGLTQLFWADQAMKGMKNMLEFDLPEREMLFQLMEGKVSVKFRPGLEIPLWQLDPAREKLYVFVPGSKDILVIDLMTQEMEDRFPIPFSPQPMNKGWASKEAKDLESRILLNGKSVSVEVDSYIPQYFPLISDFLVGPSGSLWLFDGPSLMTQHNEALVLDAQGQPIASNLPANEIDRIIALDQDHAWFLHFDKVKEVPLIRKCPRQKLTSQLAHTSNEKNDKGLKPINIRTQ